MRVPLSCWSLSIIKILSSSDKAGVSRAIKLSNEGLAALAFSKSIGVSLPLGVNYACFGGFSVP
jgi:hypothetical protein